MPNDKELKIDALKHDKIAKEYAKKRRNKKRFYRNLYFSSWFTIFIIILDFASGIIPTIWKIHIISILIVLSYLFHKKWEFLSNQPIITLECLGTGLDNKIYRGSGNINYRIGGEKITDKIKNVIKEI